MSRGSETTRQNGINIGAQFSVQTAQRISSLGGTKPTVFGFNNAAQLDVLRHEIVFGYKTEAHAKTSPNLNVMSSVNGAGEHIVSTFPNEESLQRDILLESIEVVGTSLEDVAFSAAEFDSAGVTRAFAIQIAGVTNHLATETMVPGAWLEYYMPDRSTVRSSNFIPAHNAPSPGKVTIQLRHFDPHLAGDYLYQRMSSAIYDTTKWNQMIKYAGSGSSFGRSGPAWLACAAAFKQNALFNGIMFAYRFLPFAALAYAKLAIDLVEKAGNITLGAGKTFTDLKNEVERLLKDIFNTNKQVDASDAHTSFKYVTAPLLKVAQEVGFVDEKALPPNVSAFSFADFSKLGSKMHQEFVRQFVASVLSSGRERNLCFGLNQDLKSIPNSDMPFTDGFGGKLTTDKAFGNMLFKQINIPRMYMSALVQLVRSRMSTLAGVVVRGGRANELFSYYKS